MRHPDDDTQNGDEMKPADNPLVACVLRVVWELSGEVRAAVLHGACTVRSGESERDMWPLRTPRLVFYTFLCWNPTAKFEAEVSVPQRSVDSRCRCAV